MHDIGRYQKPTYTVSIYIRNVDILFTQGTIYCTTETDTLAPHLIFDQLMFTEKITNRTSLVNNCSLIFAGSKHWCHGVGTVISTLITFSPC